MTIYVRDTRTGYKVPLVQGDDAVAAHEAAANPHPTYLTQAEGDAAYSALGHNHDADYADIAHTHGINDLTDVTVSTPATDEVLKYNGSAWVNAAAPAGASALDDLTDVTITTPTSGHVLKYNGSAWTNAAESGGGGGVTTGGILATNAYATGTDTALASTASTTFVDIDATNAAITFTAPPNGAVLVHASSLLNTNAQTTGYYWCLNDGTSDITGTSVYMHNQNPAHRANYFALVTGLTAGNSYTFKVRHRSSSTTGYVYTGPTYGKFLMVVYDADPEAPAAPSSADTITINMHNGGSVLSTGLAKSMYVVPRALTITGWRLVGYPTGSVSLTLIKKAGDIPTSSDDSIVANAHPSYSSARLASGSTLTGWTTSLAAGDVLGLVIDSVTDVTHCTLILEVE